MHHVIFLFIPGECVRRCLGGENEMVKWDIPDFSGCTSIEFRDLHEKVRYYQSSVIMQYYGKYYQFLVS